MPKRTRDEILTEAARISRVAAQAIATLEVMRRAAKRTESKKREPYVKVIAELRAAEQPITASRVLRRMRQLHPKRRLYDERSVRRIISDEHITRIAEKYFADDPLG